MVVLAFCRFGARSFHEAYTAGFSGKSAFKQCRAASSSVHARQKCEHTGTIQRYKSKSLRTPQFIRKREKPMCLYFSQNMCTMMNDQQHLEKFSHSYSRLDVHEYDLEKMQPQEVDYFLVLDLEGKVEILEFPVIMINAHSLEFVDAFHRFVRPVSMSKKRIEEYIEGKYGKIHLDRVWHDTAISFQETLQLFEVWLKEHQLWSKGNSTLNRAAFVTCGNWDVKTKIPEQCQVSKLKLPPYFMEWINIKDIYLNFYNLRASGMMAMMKGLNMPVFGTHHVGLDDAQNIARVLQRILADGALMQITAKRIGPQVKFLFKNRI